MGAIQYTVYSPTHTQTNREKSNMNWMNLKTAFAFKIFYTRKYTIL